MIASQSAVCRGWKKSFLSAVLGIVVLFAGVSAQAGVVSTIPNAGFEDQTTGWNTQGNNATVPSWTEGAIVESGGSAADDAHTYRKSTQTDGTQSYQPNPTEGLNQAMLIVRGATYYHTTSYLFQSLGTVTASDIGSTLTVSVDTAAREQNFLKSATATIGIYTGTTASALGTEVSDGGPGSMRTLSDTSVTLGTGCSTYTDGTITNTLTVDGSLLNQTLYLAVSLNDTTPYDTSDQYLFDNVRYSLVAAPVPEPGTLALLAAGLVSLAVCTRRRRMQP